jgi:hypothetical protein
MESFHYDAAFHECWICGPGLNEKQTWREFFEKRKNLSIMKHSRCFNHSILNEIFQGKCHGLTFLLGLFLDFNIT